MTDIRVKDLVLELAQYLREHPEDETRDVVVLSTQPVQTFTNTMEADSNA